jgi:hypothetical protein
VAQFLANIALGTGSQSGSTTTTTQPASFFSDKRLKENVHQVGETFDGQPIYRYNYKGQRGTQIGLIAQDVERKHPEAVGLAGGYKTVDYDRATEGAAHRGHFAYGGASMGGGVVPERAGEGFAFGGMPDYFAQILANARKGQIGAGLGGQGQGLNIPTQSGMSPGRLAVASPPPAQTSTGDDLRHAAANAKAIEGLIGSGKAALLGSAATDKSAETSGFAGAGGKWDPSKGWLGGLGAAHGGAIRGYATNGRVNDDDASPYGVPSFVPNKELNIPALKTAQAGSGQSGGVGSDIMDAAKFASSIAGLASLFSDKRLKENVHQIGKTFDGQPVYRYNYKGHPETQIGLIAQDVESKHPEAVGLAGGYKTVDYRRATEDAAHRGHFAYGGIAPRHGFQAGGQPGEEGDDVNRLLRPEWRQRQYDRSEAEGRAGLAPPSVRQLEAAPDEYDPMGNRTGYSSAPPVGLAGSSQNVSPQSQNVDTLSPDITRPTLRDFLRNPWGSAQDWLYQSRREATPSGRGLNPTPPSMSGEPAPPEVGRYSDLVNRVELEAANQPPAAGVVPSGRQAPPAAGVVPPGRQAPGLGRDQSVGPHPLTPGGASVDATSAATPPVGQGTMPQPAPVVGGMPAARPEKADEGSGGSWFSRNQDWLVPLLTGVGTMAASPSRFMGSALAQGLAGAAGAYGNVQTQMAQRAKTEAETGAQQVGAARAAFTPITGLGPVVPVIDPKTGATVPMQMSEYRRRVAAGERLQTVGVPSGAPYEGASAANAPIAPPEPTVNNGVSFNPAVAQSENLQGANYEDQIKQSGKYMESTRGGAEAARGSRFNTIEAASTIANAIASGDRNALSTPGAYAAERAQIANMANTFGRMIGAGDIAGTADTNAAILAKLNNAMAGQTVSATDERSLQALRMALSAQPGVAMPPDAAAELSSHALVHNQRLIDKNVHLDQYVATSPQGTAYNAATDFDSTNSQQKYNREQQAFKTLMMDPRGAKAIELMKKGGASPQQAEEYLYRNTGIKGMSRYFMSGG